MMPDINNGQFAQSLTIVLEDLTHWLSAALRSLFYNENHDFSPEMPLSYQDWLAEAKDSETIPDSLLGEIFQSEKALLNALHACSEQKGRPDGEVFDSFLKFYEDFHNKLLRLETESLLSEAGIDPATGFKSYVSLFNDLMREMDRRSRRGNPFSIILVRLDHYETEDDRLSQVQNLSLAIRKCNRSFDDIYRLSDRDFLVSLKHSDSAGATKFSKRLRSEMRESKCDFSVSTCVAEPEPGDDVASMLKNMERELADMATKSPGETIKYEDVSPLQRFVSTIKKKT